MRKNRGFIDLNSQIFDPVFFSDPGHNFVAANMHVARRHRLWNSIALISFVLCVFTALNVEEKQNFSDCSCF